ncbi:hypothetical protein [Paenibacillus sp. D2_2]
MCGVIDFETMDVGYPSSDIVMIWSFLVI